MGLFNIITAKKSKLTGTATAADIVAGKTVGIDDEVLLTGTGVFSTKKYLYKRGTQIVPLTSTKTGTSASVTWGSAYASISTGKNSSLTIVTTSPINVTSAGYTMVFARIKLNARYKHSEVASSGTSLYFQLVNTGEFIVGFPISGTSAKPDVKFTYSTDDTTSNAASWQLLEMWLEQKGKEKYEKLYPGGYEFSYLLILNKKIITFNTGGDF